jgi:prolyl-tRNA synthetase
MSTLFGRTLRDDPADAESPGHRLLVRAGYIRRVAPGIYSWLPLGYRLLRAVESIVRTELAAIGSQEVHFPALAPEELYATSGRLDMYGDLLFRLTDRKSARYLLAPTHEELFTTLVKGELSSYKDYPLSLFQIQTKYRDEARPRGGILRGREFLMKDGYSFDLDAAGLRESYERHRGAYLRIFEKLGMRVRLVSAVSGAMGGSNSEEFLAPSDAGEDTFVHCEQCDYAANSEAVQIALPVAPATEPPPMQILDTPDSPTIDSLVNRLADLHPEHKVDAGGTLKNVVVATREPGAKNWELLVVGVPGDREVDMRRLAGSLDPVEVTPADADLLATRPELVKGYIGPQMLAEAGIRYLVDPLVVPGSAWVTGANAADRHAVNVVRGRDFEPAGEIGAASLRAGDRCVRCGGLLQVSRGIEVAYIFELGRRYSDAFGLAALGPDGKPVPITMGCYGLGISRVVGALAEQCHDEHGLIWPRIVAPADVHLVIAGNADAVRDAAVAAADRLAAAGVDVLLDDRSVSAGVKFADAELIGVPTIGVFGRGLVRGEVELRDRVSGVREDIPLADLMDRLQERA